MNLYLKIKSLLEENRLYRNSYAELRWRIWEDEGSVVNNFMTKTQYLKATDAETIRRTCQKCVEAHPELDADDAVKDRRIIKEKTGGNFVFNNSKKIFDEQKIRDTMTVLEMKWKGRTDKIGEEYEHDRNMWKKYNGMLKGVVVKIEPKAEDELTKFATQLFGT